MKISIDKTNLISALDTVSKAAPVGRNLVQLLNGVLLEAKDRKLSLTRNNLDIALKRTIDCEVPEAGNAIVDAKFFSGIVREMPDEEIDIVTSNSTMSLDVSEVHMEIPLMSVSAKEFPGLPLVFGETKFTMANLREMVEGVSFAVCDDDTRPVFKGILVTSKAGTLDMVALDGHVMGLRRQRHEKAGIPDVGVIPMGTDLEAVAKLFDKDPVEITVGENKMSLSTPDAQAVIRTIHGEFINYVRLIPAEFTATAKITIRELQQAIDRSLLFVRTENGRPTGTLEMTVKNDRMALSLRGDSGIFDEALKFETDGEMRIDFNPMMLGTVLKHVDEKEALMKFTSPTGPCIISPVEGDKFAYMVLPVRM